MERYHVDDLHECQPDDEVDFSEFLREASMSMGVYSLPPGATDPQDPHTEDEAYYVVSGTAKIAVDGETAPAQPGDVIYVERGVDHRFFDVEERLVTLVFFAPAEGSLGECV
jgi:mannose-6-phosphate isomerase-like protein (cupin superfamily)